ncbi:M15 family peptidase [Oceanobacillus piezotolerans]|uniref:M15 family peptidase n=1 Tax=Oceanobacillus piezotolerans TaxID=2448030 RepID=A0A498D569_9BACI|nr:M15 family metallopeptidase [Oceanobacillus piezotolerans]RLL42091.1 M15 family peptidase [Oceanobacillus piezotolerans]
MKRFFNILLSWFIIAFLLIGLFYLYNVLNPKHYLYLGEDAPISTELHPIVEERKNILISEARHIGIEVIITEEVRTMERQQALYDQGRTSDGSIVTYAEAGESYHNYGLAIDYALENNHGELIWNIEYDGNNNGKADWFEVADIAKQLGFTWGGDWTHFKDYSHLEMTFGLSIEQLKQGYRPKEEIKDVIGEPK